MSLSATLQIGKSALTATQAAIHTVGNNIAGASDPNYTRQVARVQSAQGQRFAPTIYLGGGVDLSSVQRQIDDALMTRLRGGIADESGAGATAQWLDQLEAVFNELSDQDLSTAASAFFNAWSDLASRPTDPGLRQIVLQEGHTLARKLNDAHASIDELASQAGARLGVLTDAADDLSRRIADVNGQITRAEGGRGPSANDLRDRRDALLGELASLVNIHTQEQSNGGVNVYVGSAPLIEGDRSRGVRLEQLSRDGQTVYLPRMSNGAPLNARTGAIGGTEAARQKIEETRAALDRLAGGLIFELNKLHSTGQGLTGYDTITAGQQVIDPAAGLDSPGAGLAFPPQNGSFVINLRDKATGHTTQSLISVTLDGSVGGTSLGDLAASIDAVTGVSATIINGKLTIRADSPGQDISFADDTSHVLAALGVGGFFSGTTAADIAVASSLDDPRRLAASRNGQPGDNGTARLIAAMQDVPLKSLGGSTFAQSYQTLTYAVSTSTAAARGSAESAGAVREALEAQRQAISGVSMDEEAVTLLRYQRSYQGAARLVTAVDEMMQTILRMI